MCIRDSAGSRPLVELDTEDKMKIVLQEILQDKIYLDAADEVQISPEAGPELDLANLNPDGM